MNYDFDTPLSRRGSHSLKYDARQARFGREDLLPVWVADMDFAAPPCVTEALAARVQHPIYGYTLTPASTLAAICNWQMEQHGWEVDPGWVNLVPGVVPGLGFAVMALTEPGDGVIVQPPVYYPFYDVVKGNRRRLLRNPLLLEQGRYRIDYEQLESIAPDARLLLLSSPHNPGGAVWRAEELERLGEICLRHGVTIIADEIHADLVFAPHRHRPLASLSPELADITLTLNSAGKSFNVPGLNTAYAIISNPELRQCYQARFRAQHLDGVNLLGMTALEAAYRGGGEWLQQLLVYLRGNIDLSVSRLAEKLPAVKVMIPEATYLLWLDFRAAGLEDGELKRRMIDEARLAMNPGVQFGAEGSGFMRMNVGLPRAHLDQALRQLVDAFA